MPFAQAPFAPFVAKPGAMADADHLIPSAGKRPGGMTADKACCPEYCRLLHCRSLPSRAHRVACPRFFQQRGDCERIIAAMLFAVHQEPEIALPFPDEHVEGEI